MQTSLIFALHILGMTGKQLRALSCTHGMGFGKQCLFLLISGEGLFTFISTSLKVPPEHKYTVKTGDRKNGVAVHALDEQHTVD